MSAKSDILRVEGLGIAFALHAGEITAVKDASFRVLPGKVTALVGESGSGKSVIAQSIMGILPRVGRITHGCILFTDPAAGRREVDLAKLDVASEEYRHLRGARMSMIFQEPMTSLSPLHTIGDQIGEALRIHSDLPKKEIGDRTKEMLDLVGFPSPSRAYGMYPFELSGGLRQRAMIAMALICRPALLIADEPTTALDVTIQAQILELLVSLQEKLGMAILLITHDLGIVANIADEVVVIYHGEIMEAGTIDDIMRRSSHPYLKALMAAVPTFDMLPGQRLKALREVNTRAGEVLGESVRARPKADEGAGALLSATGLTKTFQTRRESWFGKRDDTKILAVDDVSFDVRRGECLGLVGESGCGKTTISKLIMRALTPDAGEVVFDGGSGPLDVLRAEGSALKDLRTRIQMVFQDPFSSLSPRMTVRNILSEPLQIHERGDSDYRRERVTKLMEAVGLDPRYLSRYPHSFSGGQRQRIGIARALALGPDLLICDEPVSALDVSVQAQILNLLKDLQKELGLTYLFISHNLAVVDYMADRIAVMRAGRIVEMAPRHTLFRKPVHPYTRALLAAVPYPDLDRPLDFGTLNLGGTSEVEAWDPVFRPDRGAPRLVHRDLGDDHRVLARADASLAELRQ
ncbi:MAG: ABC transporter ATP-binding protein [Hyphomicrobiales bacterium]